MKVKSSGGKKNVEKQKKDVKTIFTHEILTIIINKLINN